MEMRSECFIFINNILEKFNLFYPVFEPSHFCCIKMDNLNK